MKGENMKKKTKKTMTNGSGNVYVFHNTKTGIDLFMNAPDADSASTMFDLCDFQKRADWKILVELTHQPA